MLSSDHPALSFENFWFSCVLFCFLFSPISTNVFSVAGDRHFHHGMDQKLAVSTFPMHGLHRNTAFNCGRKPKEIIRNTKALNQLDYLIVPLVSFDFLWFGLGGFYGFPLVSFGFLRFPLVWILWFSFDSLRFSSVSFGLDSMVFLWFPLVSKEKTNQPRKVQGGHTPIECINHACNSPSFWGRNPPMLWRWTVAGGKPLEKQLFRELVS